MHEVMIAVGHRGTNGFQIFQCPTEANINTYCSFTWMKLLGEALRGLEEPLVHFGAALARGGERVVDVPARQVGEDVLEARGAAEGEDDGPRPAVQEQHVAGSERLPGDERQVRPQHVRGRRQAEEPGDKLLLGGVLRRRQRHRTEQPEGGTLI